MQNNTISQLGFDFGDNHLPSAEGLLFDSYVEFIARCANKENWLGNIAFIATDEKELKEFFLRKLNYLGIATIDFDATDYMQALEYFYEAENNEASFMLIGAIREIPQPDLKSRFDNVLKFHSPAISIEMFENIWNKWTLPRGITYPKNAALSFYQQINYTTVILKQFFDYIENYCKNMQKLRSSDINKIAEDFTQEYLEFES